MRNDVNTPVIIKFPFWKYTERNKKAFYACINKGEAGCADRIAKRSVCIDSGVNEVLYALKQGSKNVTAQTLSEQ